MRLYEAEPRRGRQRLKPKLGDRGPRVGAEREACREHGEFIDKIGLEQSGRELPAALAKHARQTFVAERRQQSHDVGGVQSPVLLAQFDQLRAETGPLGPPRLRSGGPVDEPERNLPRNTGEPAPGG